MAIRKNRVRLRFQEVQLVESLEQAERWVANYEKSLAAWKSTRDAIATELARVRAELK